MISELKRILRFGLVGLTASALYAVLTGGFVDLLGVRPVLASVLAYLISIPVSFFGQKYFAFGSQGGIAPELGKYLAVQFTNLALAAGIMKLVTETLGLSHWIGIPAAIVVNATLSYVFFARLVFTRRG